MEEFDLAQALVDLSLTSARQPATPQAPHSNTDPSRDASAFTTPLQHDAFTAPQLTPHRHHETGTAGGQSSSGSQEALTQSSLTLGQQVQKCLIILQDACVQHQFARPIRQRDLDSIVERPQRSRAATIGILVALARLQQHTLPSFDIQHCTRRGWLGDQAVEAVHGYVYPQDLLKLSSEAADKLARGELEVPEGYPFGDLYLGPASLDALNGCLGATYDAVDALFAPGDAYDRCHVCIRPPGHHAAEISPSGFCWLNNVHIGIAYARAKFGIRRAVILDFDLHHGDGSQDIAWKLNEATPDSIAYYSIHDIRSFPCEMGDIAKIREASVSISAHGHNIHNVHLEPWSTPAEFDALYKRSFAAIFEKAAKFLAPAKERGEPCLVCISAGYDASEHENPNMQRHVANVPTTFYQRFTEDAVALAKTYANGKVLSVMEGGYGDRAIISAAASHMLGLADAPIQADRAEMQSWLSLDNLMLIEKAFPSKPRARKPALDPAPGKAWLHQVDKLVATHLPSLAATESPVKSELAGELGKMTLRTRAPRSTPIASPNKVPRSVSKRTNQGQQDGETPSKPTATVLPSLLETAQLPVPEQREISTEAPNKMKQPPQQQREAMPEASPEAATPAKQTSEDADKSFDIYAFIDSPKAAPIRQF